MFLPTLPRQGRERDAPKAVELVEELEALIIAGACMDVLQNAIIPAQPQPEDM